MWRFVGSEILPAMRLEIGSPQRSVAFDHDDLNRFPRKSVWDSHDAGFQHARMHGDDFLYFIRIDLKAGHIDHILLTIDDANKAV